MAISPANMDESDQPKDAVAFKTLASGLCIGALSMSAYALCPANLRHGTCVISVSVIVASASAAFGGLFGFLFGVPRVPVRSVVATPALGTGNQPSTAVVSTPAIEPNTNLEQISDWLTKILVGAGLTQLNKIPTKIGTLCGFISQSMNGSDLDKGYIGGVIIFFGICGFLGAFLWTKLYMGDLLNRSEAEELRKKDQEQQATIDLLKKKAQADAERSMKNAETPDQLDSAGRTQVKVAAEFIEADPVESKSPEGLYILAYSQYQSQEYEMAIGTATRALAAKPPEELLWSIYDLLGLSYHWEMPNGWKPGDSMVWFERAKDSYENAVKSTTNINEEQIAKSNLCFLYLDAQKYDECERLSQEILNDDRFKTLAGERISDLARIAYATARAVRNDLDSAAKALNQTVNLASFDYLFNSENLPRRGLEIFLTLPGLKPEVAATLKRMITL